MDLKNREPAAIANELADRIDSSILPLITSDYVLWGLPYYINPGDTLIWEGTLEMLGKCRHRCLGTCGWDEYEHVPLDKGTVILILGGGYFGDVWRKAWEHVMNTLIHYPDHPIILLPQSIHYEDRAIAEKDRDRLAGCKDLTICARDRDSYDFASSFFYNRVVLVPDMAFHVKLDKLRRWVKPESGKQLYLKRRDKEMPAGLAGVPMTGIMDVSDWSAMQNGGTWQMKGIVKLYSVFRKRRRRKVFRELETLTMSRLQRNRILKEAVRFISRYETVYATRLHAMILAFLLGKDVVILDNSYGKVNACYRTWLSGYPKIRRNG